MLYGVINLFVLHYNIVYMLYGVINLFVLHYNTVYMYINLLCGMYILTFISSLAGRVSV